MDEAAAPQDDEEACEASGQVSRSVYRPETKELRELLRGSLSDPEVSFNALFGSGIRTFLLSVMCPHPVLRQRSAAAAIPYIVPLLL